MEFADLLHARRSVRRYRDEPVDMDVVREMIRESTLAPSAGNGQPWQFVIVTDKTLMKTMSDQSKHYLLDRMNANPDDHANKYRSMLEKPGYNVYYNAPCLVIIGGDAELKNLVADCSLAACYFMMAATARGLGTCWINLGAELHDPDTRRTLGMPETFRIVAPIIVGHPAAVPSMPTREEPKILRVID